MPKKLGLLIVTLKPMINKAANNFLTFGIKFDSKVYY